ncbi:MAG: hypothetical protein PHF86_05340 [Candidatus Nanoarchaeia archaeon]|jgi:hypothetical protein|nr:hypothetical protein [Candidatus Nanoarchaeia archaeon]
MQEESIELTTFKERCWTLYGFKIGKFIFGWLKYLDEGEEFAVEFDWRKGLSKFIIGWFHTHPTTVTLNPSKEDKKTMRSWVRTLERPLICGIMYDHKKRREFLWRNCYLFKRWPGGNVNYQPIMRDKLIKHFYIGIL